MEFEGFIPPFSILDVMQIIRDNKLTGTLEIKDSENILILFRNGNVIYGKVCNNSTEHKHIIERMQQLDKLALIADIQKSINCLSKIKDVSFHFKPTTISNVKAKVELPVQKVILEISREIELLENYSTKISNDFVPDKAKDYKSLISAINLSIEEIIVLNKVDGRKTVGEIISSLSSEIKDEGTIRKILYGLLATGIIKRAEKKFKLNLKTITTELIGKIISKIRGL